MSIDPSAFGWVDWVLLVVLLVSVLVGLWRGLVFEVLSLAGWVAAFIAAQALAPALASVLPIGVPGSALDHGVAFLVAFVLALVLWALASRLVRLLIDATPLQPVDRVLGGVFGLARGAVLLLVIATVVLLTPAQRSPAWQQSRGAVWLGAALQGLKPLLPDAIGRHLPPLGRSA
jgi:membrane protein required for colicin V production